MQKSDQGIDSKKYLIIPRTLIFIFNQRSQVLLLCGAKDKRLWAGLHNGIGGHVEAGEDILESAQRELWEETGINEIPLLFCGQIMIDVEPRLGVGVFLFQGHYEGEALQSSAEGELVWADLDAIENLALVEDLPLLIPKIAAYKAGDPLLIGKYAYDTQGELNISFW
jgi:8-oxo-dGTP diphosphatase